MNKKTIFRHFLMLLALLLCSARASAQEAYACYTVANTTLTFYYDTQRSSRAGRTYDMNTGVTMPGWHNDRTCDDVTKVVFDPSFAAASPTSTYSWFYEMEKLESITDISFLNTANVTTMAYMFRGCKGLTSLNLSNFNTAKVTNMGLMFNGCSSLTSLDLSNFNTAKVTNMSAMFSNCTNLRTIYVGDGWSTVDVTASQRMFTNSTSLVGGKGTIYDDSNPRDKTYAHIDGGTSNPGYLSEKPAFLLGDVNGDGKVTPADAIMILYHYFGVEQSGFILDAADLNGDSKITPADAIETLYKYFGASSGSSQARSTRPTANGSRDPE